MPPQESISERLGLRSLVGPRSQQDPISRAFVRDTLAPIAGVSQLTGKGLNVNRYPAEVSKILGVAGAVHPWLQKNIFVESKAGPNRQGVETTAAHEVGHLAYLDMPDSSAVKQAHIEAAKEERPDNFIRPLLESVGFDLIPNRHANEMFAENFEAAMDFVRDGTDPNRLVELAEENNSRPGFEEAARFLRDELESLPEPQSPIERAMSGSTAARDVTATRGQ